MHTVSPFGSRHRRRVGTAVVLCRQVREVCPENAEGLSGCSCRHQPSGFLLITRHFFLNYVAPCPHCQRRPVRFILDLFMTIVLLLWTGKHGFVLVLDALTCDASRQCTCATAHDFGIPGDVDGMC